MQCFGSAFTESGSRSKHLANLDPGFDCIPIRIQTMIFFKTKNLDKNRLKRLLKFLQRTFRRSFQLNRKLFKDEIS